MPVQMLDSVLDLVRHGLTPVRLHYPIITESETRCSCGNPKCPENSRGKHPVEKAWGKSATDDVDIIRDRWGQNDWNVGIVLGICHGIAADKAIIDIEDDSLEGREFANTLLGDYPAPSYTSGKSIHRLYRWSEKLPPVANMTINGLEFRFGGKGLETQSVAPPSLHRTGARYAWVDGKSLDDMAIPELPQHVVEWLTEEYSRQESTRGTKSSSGTAKFRSPTGKIGVGSRHHSLLKYANSLWRMMFEMKGINGLDEQEVIDHVWMILAGQNALVCDPPKSELELENIFRSSQQFMRSEIEKELEEKLAQKLIEAQAEPTEEKSDLDTDSFGGWLQKHQIYLRLDPMFGMIDEDPDRIDEWRCKWEMTYVVKGDEETVEIKVPGIENDIQMTLAEFDIAGKFSRRVQQETGGEMILGRTFTIWNWETIWNGRKNDSKGKNGITRGLKEYLQANAKVRVRDENSLSDQVEDLCDRLAGPRHSLVSALRAWLETGNGFSGRLKLTPGSDQLTKLKLPEDPNTGLYYVDGELWFLVKLSELSHQYRRAFGGVVSSRHLTEAVESCGFTPKRFIGGPAEGRWYGKVIEKE